MVMIGRIRRTESYVPYTFLQNKVMFCFLFVVLTICIKTDNLFCLGHTTKVLLELFP